MVLNVLNISSINLNLDFKIIDFYCSKLYISINPCNLSTNLFDNIFKIKVVLNIVF